MSPAAPRIWAGGSEVYTQGGDVISSLDWETYRKTAATGTGTVDPANDISKYISLSYERISALTLSRVVSEAGNQGVFGVNVPKTALPAIPMGNRTLLGSTTGRGHALILAFYLNGTTSVNARFEIVIDGRTVYDYTQSLLNNYGVLFLGNPLGAGNNVYHYFLPSSFKVPFKRSLQIYITPINTSIGINSYLQMQIQPEA